VVLWCVVRRRGAASSGIGVELIGMKLAHRLHVDLDVDGVAAVLGP